MTTPLVVTFVGDDGPRLVNAEPIIPLASAIIGTGGILLANAPDERVARRCADWRRWGCASRLSGPTISRRTRRRGVHGPRGLAVP
ncbi:MAG: hypothetical protein JO288_02035 [Hyphomicrobiales bacterium]|nr:hypothetical protein [Hyphomicrobiales bacterium]